MDDIPQGGSGGVPGHHHDDPGHPGTPDSPATPGGPSDGRGREAKTVRAGQPVAEQRTDRKADRQESGDREQSTSDRPDE
ncbi:hypothetical protein ACFWA9_00515 [Kitasatospora sp. NPDC059973]|uniref:hypothetical protein n=1 Tax=Kitasatospora sp. NPDC059973 TaxID=3347020 RepID=UPI0036BEF270